ncbi:MAG: YceD family protein [Bacteroides sp.]|nr:YceD family protein [Roseburia sp.]MCM1346977.1 YceD family protein [Bacteroides sp.]MCM1421603.1 YceD family protein [Bacteroides sp.]
MDKKENYIIDLTDSRIIGASYEFVIGDSFFEQFGGAISRGNVHTVVKCEYSGSLFRFTIHSEGQVVTPCDRCLADVELMIDTTDVLVAKLGTAYSDDGDSVTVDMNDGELDLSSFIYEFITLSLPIKCVHEDGGCDVDMISALSKYQIDIESEEL